MDGFVGYTAMGKKAVHPYQSGSPNMNVVVFCENGYLYNDTKSFGGISALKDVTFKVEPGEIHAVVGENGAGKSTLMKILSGAHLKDSGKIFVDDTEVNIKTTHDSKKLGISIIYLNFLWIEDFEFTFWPLVGQTRR